MALSISGLAVLVAGAWMGGHLVFRHGEGVREDESRKPEVGSRK